MKTIMAISCLILMVSVGSVGAGVPSTKYWLQPGEWSEADERAWENEKLNQAKCWEYRRVSIYYFEREFDEILTVLGSQRWEMMPFTVELPIKCLIFKRPIECKEGVER